MNLVVIFLVFFVSKEPASVFAQLSLKEGLTVFRDPIYIFFVEAVVIINIQFWLNS